MAEQLTSLKIKRSKSPGVALDEQYLKTITTLNDSVICEALREKDTNSALALLKQLEQSIKVHLATCRPETTEPTRRARSTTTTICLPATTT
jgi:hypothetical protein